MNAAKNKPAMNGIRGNNSKNKKNMTSNLPTTDILNMATTINPFLQETAPGSPISMGTIEQYVNYPENYNSNGTPISTARSNSNNNLHLANFAMGWFDDIPIPEKFMAAADESNLANASFNSSSNATKNRSLPWWALTSSTVKPIPIKRTYKTYRSQRRRRNTRRYRK